ncbi:ribonuclease H-like domain, reverse transcriptase, RNA-dependent DNA polymerase [Tanacetum coccineum]
MQEVILFYKGLDVFTRQIFDSKGAVPMMNAANSKKAIQEMADHSQKWHNGTSTRCRSCDTSNGPTAIQAQLNNLGREIKKVNEKVYAAQVGLTFPQGGRYRLAAPGFYQRDNGSPSYQERKQTMEETLSKFMAESLKRHEEHSTMIKEIRASTNVVIRNQGASIKALEIQIGQLSKKLRHHRYVIFDPIDTLYNENEVLKEFEKLQVISSESASSLKRLLRENWRIEEEIKEKINEHCSTIIKWDLPQKERDLGSFTLPCTINNIRFNKALADLGASVSVMPYSTFTNLGLGKLASTKLIIKLADKMVKHTKGIAENVLVEIDKFVFPVDFVILDIPEDSKTPIIIGRPFLSTAHAKIDVFKRKFYLKVRKDKIVFKSDNITNHLRNNDIEDLGPIIGEGEVIDELNGDIVKTRDDNVMVEKIDEYPIVENINAYRDKDMSDAIVGKPFYREVCVEARRFDGFITIYNGPEYIKDEKMVKWLTRGHVSMHEMDLKLEQV